MQLEILLPLNQDVNAANVFLSVQNIRISHDDDDIVHNTFELEYLELGLEGAHEVVRLHRVPPLRLLEEIDPEETVVTVAGKCIRVKLRKRVETLWNVGVFAHMETGITSFSHI